MSEEELKTISYLYKLTKRDLKLGKYKGLKAKSAFDYVQQVQKLAKAIKEEKILDFEEVMAYED